MFGESLLLDRRVGDSDAVLARVGFRFLRLVAYPAHRYLQLNFSLILTQAKLGTCTMNFLTEHTDLSNLGQGAFLGRQNQASLSTLCYKVNK